jgi:hypothetical protein
VSNSLLNGRLALLQEIIPNRMYTKNRALPNKFTDAKIIEN